MPERDKAMKPGKTDHQNQELLTPSEVAKRLGVSPVTVRSWVSKGWLRSYSTLGGHGRFKWEEVRDFVEKRNSEKDSRDAVKILVVDDDPQFRSYLVESLSLLVPDAIIRESQDGFQAGLEIANFDPVLILLDYDLPGIDGIEVCKMIRGMHRHEGVFILAISGRMTESIRKKLLNCGANDVLDKPLPFATLKEKLNSLELLS